MPIVQNHASKHLIQKIRSYLENNQYYRVLVAFVIVFCTVFGAMEKRAVADQASTLTANHARVDAANQKMIAEMKKHVGSGDVSVQYGVGLMELTINRDHKEALKYLLLASAQGDAGAQYLVGEIYYRGEGGIKVDYKKAISYFIQSAEGNNANARYALGTMYFTGTGGEQSFTRAIQFFDASAEQGHPDARCALGLMYYIGDVNMEYPEAKMCHSQGTRKTTDAANFDTPDKQDSASQDITALKKLADQGEAYPQIVLAWYYFLGDEIEKDHKRAAHYFELAAKQGIARAQFQIGWLYFRGDGVRQDSKKALHYLTLGSAQGDVHAQYNLGWMHMTGMGALRNYDKAIQYFDLAEKQGDLRALKTLAKFYYEGNGVERDEEKAKMYLRRAIAKGDVAAKGILDGILASEEERYESGLWKR